MPGLERQLAFQDLDNSMLIHEHGQRQFYVQELFRPRALAPSAYASCGLLKPGPELTIGRQPFAAGVFVCAAR